MSQNGGEDFIEGAAVELKKLLDREAIGIAEGIGFAVSHGESPFVKKRPPQKGTSSRLTADSSGVSFAGVSSWEALALRSRRRMTSARMYQVVIVL